MVQQKHYFLFKHRHCNSSDRYTDFCQNISIVAIKWGCTVHIPSILFAFKRLHDFFLYFLCHRSNFSDMIWLILASSQFQGHLSEPVTLGKKNRKNKSPERKWKTCPSVFVSRVWFFIIKLGRVNNSPVSWAGSLWDCDWTGQRVLFHSLFATCGGSLLWQAQIETEKRVMRDQVWY